jgi:hypothetical protein
MSVRSGDNLVRVGSEEDDLDRLTNTPEGSGGASPTVTASWQDDDDLIADHDHDTQPADVLSSSSALTSRTPVADGNGKATLASADPVAEAAPALPADSIGSPRDTSVFSFTRPVSAPVSPGVEDRPPSDPGGSPTAGEPVLAGQGAASPIDSALFRPTSITEPATEDASPVAPSPSEPSPPTVSAAAFAWEVPEPPATSPSSPARNFLRSSGSAKASAPPAAPPVTVKPAKPAPGRAPAPAGGKPQKQKGSAQRPARQAHLTVARVEPWSVMKFSFVVSLVAFVILFVAVTILYGTLSALGVFESLQRVVTSVTSSQDSGGVNAAKWWSASRVLGYTGLLGSLNIVLITAMSTIGAVVYNLTSRLIGGVEVTLRETE